MGNSSSCGKNLRGMLGLSESASDAEILLAVKTLVEHDNSAKVSGSKISLEHMLGVFDALPSAFIITDSELQVWYCNKLASELCGLKFADIEDSSLYTPLLHFVAWNS